MTNTTELQPKKGFLIWNMIGQGWQIMKKNVWQLLGYQIIFPILLFLLLRLINILLPSDPEALWYFQLSNGIVSTLVNECFTLGILTLSLQFADNVPVTFSNFFSKMHYILRYFVASLLKGACIILGLICFIVPGIIIATRFSLVGYLIIDKDMGVIEALKQSWHLVKGVTGRMIGFWLATFLVLLLGLLCLGVGLLFAIPTTSIASALVYRALLKN